MRENLKGKSLSTVLFLICSFNFAYSQIITPIPAPIYTDYLFKNNQWFDSLKAPFQTAFPVLRFLPPVTTSMPLEVKSAYFWLDSIARAGYTFSKTEFTPTMRELIRNIMLASRYNPGLFQQYADNTRRRYFDYELKPEEVAAEDNLLLYKNAYSNIEFGIDKIMRDLYSSKENNKYAAVLMPNYIFRGKIIDVVPISSGGRAEEKKDHFMARVLVSDKIKGDILPNAATQGDSVIVKMIFNQYDYSQANGYVQSIDEEFLNQYNELSLKPNQEGIFFCSFTWFKKSTTDDYYDIEFTHYTSNGGLPIINGKVRDHKNIWSNEIYLDYDKWKEKYTEVEEKLLNGNF